MLELKSRFNFKSNTEFNFELKLRANSWIYNQIKIDLNLN